MNYYNSNNKDIDYIIASFEAFKEEYEAEEFKELLDDEIDYIIDNVDYYNMDELFDYFEDNLIIE